MNGVSEDGRHFLNRFESARSRVRRLRHTISLVDIISNISILLWVIAIGVTFATALMGSEDYFSFLLLLDAGAAGFLAGVHLLRAACYSYLEGAVGNYYLFCDDAISRSDSGSIALAHVDIQALLSDVQKADRDNGGLLKNLGLEPIYGFYVWFIFGLISFLGCIAEFLFSIY